MFYVSDDEFARLVSEDVKNKISMRQKEILLDPNNWGRWQRALLMLIDNVDNQLEEINMDRQADRNRYEAMGRDGKTLLQESESAYSSRLMKIERFKFHINRRLDDVARLIETEPTDTKVDNLSISGNDAGFFKKAIIQHRSLYEKYDIEPTGIDAALWQALDNKWVFGELNESNI